MLSSCSGESANQTQVAQKPRQPSYSVEQPLVGLPAPEPRPESFRRGVALGVFPDSTQDDEQVKPVYTRLLDELVTLGVTDVEFVVAWVQTDAQALEMTPDPVYTVDDDMLRWLMGAARQRKLRVFLAPLLQVDHAASGGRSALAPADWDRWWWSYRRFVVHYARIAEAHDAAMFSVGTELTTSEQHGERWREIIGLVRKVFDGPITYTANVERLEQVSFWDALDVVSLTGHHALAGHSKVSDGELDESYRTLARRLDGWAKQHKRGFLLTGAGFAADRQLADGSAAGAALAGEQLFDLRKMRALFTALQKVTRLEGIYASTWLERGRVRAGAESMRQTPAAAVARHWFKVAARAPAAAVAPAASPN